MLQTLQINPQRQHCELLADFIRFGLVELVFHGHKFYFKLNKE